MEVQLHHHWAQQRCVTIFYEITDNDLGDLRTTLPLLCDDWNNMTKHDIHFIISNNRFVPRLVNLPI